jgi:hypothetical protein
MDVEGAIRKPIDLAQLYAAIERLRLSKTSA